MILSVVQYRVECTPDSRWFKHAFQTIIVHILKSYSYCAVGKTDEAQADMARLALIRKQREETAKKREQERKGLRLKYPI